MKGDTMSVARNIVNQILDESGADVDTRQRINDDCDRFVANMIDDRLIAVLVDLHSDVREVREEAWAKYMETSGNGEIEILRQGKFEGIDRISKRIAKVLKGVRDVRNGRH